MVQISKRNFLKIFLISLVIVLVIVGVFTQFIAESNKEAAVLVFYHWWTSAGEQNAIDTLVDLFSKKYPDITVVPTPVLSQGAGGGGLTLFNLVKPMVFAKEAPDAFQIHAGYETKIFVDAGLLEPVDNIWQSENLSKTVPVIIQKMCQFQGEYYSVPIDIHRTNVIWYNQRLIDENNINVLELNTWDKFFEACDDLRASGVNYPIQMGRTWTAQHTFDQIIASIGIDFYEDWVNGKVISADDSRLIEAFEIFERYLVYVNPDHETTSWDSATKRIISGEGAFNIMGDWANGEFKNENQIYNEDYGTIPVPGTSDMYGLVIDSFQRPKNILHPTSAEKWLKVVASKEGQDTFNPLKGSISARIDTDISKYDLYQQSAILDFIVIKKMFPAVSNGLPKQFETKEQEVIENFMKDRNMNKAVKEITDYAKGTSLDYTITWELG